MRLGCKSLIKREWMCILFAAIQMHATSSVKKNCETDLTF